MGLAATTVWEVELAGSDTNGGQVNSATVVTDYSKQTSAQVALTNAVAAGTSTITDASAPFTSAMVGNGVYLQGGTGSLAAGWYQVLTYVNSTTITVDRTVATGTGITLNLGGAMASIGGVSAGGFTTSHIMFVKYNATPYSITTATANVSGGTITSSAANIICGYNTNRVIGNTDTPPTINYGVASVTMFGTRGLYNNLIINGNGQTSARVASGDSGVLYNCQLNNMNLVSGASLAYIGCTATGNSVNVFAAISIGCESYGNTTSGFTGVNAINCISYNNTGASSYGFQLNGSGIYLKNCVAYGNGSDGFNFTNALRSSACINCHAEANTGHGFNGEGGGEELLLNCSTYNNTAGSITGFSATTTINLGFITVTAGSVFVNAASNNFALNSTANQGALLRAAGWPATFPDGVTANYIDIGAAQSQASGGGTTLYAPNISPFWGQTF